MSALPLSSAMSEPVVYAGHLSYCTTEAELLEHMRKAGEVRSVSSFRVPDGRGALVSYCSMAEAERAVAELDGTVLYGRHIFVCHDEGAKTRKRGKVGLVQPSNCVYVGNLGFDVTWQSLKDHFATCGTVMRAHVKKGHGIVEFETQEMASAAIQTMNDGEFFGRTSRPGGLGPRRGDLVWWQQTGQRWQRQQRRQRQRCKQRRPHAQRYSTWCVALCQRNVQSPSTMCRVGSCACYLVHWPSLMLFAYGVHLALRMLGQTIGIHHICGRHLSKLDHA